MRLAFSLAGGALLLTLTACSGQGAENQQGNADAPAAQPVAGAPPFAADLPSRELMAHVVQYSADGIWKWQGVEIDAKGEHSLYPKNAGEWEQAESASLTLAEVTNTLLVPGRRVPEPEWDRSVQLVRKIALEAAAAAEKHDEEAFFAAGAKLDAACDTCHERYDPRFDPRFKQ